VNCPRPDEMDRCLENELDEAFAGELERHMDACPPCRARMEERKAFIAAFRDLPDIEIPPGFTSEIMARIFPEKRSAFAWLAALIGSFSGLFLGGLAYVLATGQSLPGFTISAGKSLWGSGRDGFLILAKVGKLAALSFQLMIQFAGSFVEKLGRLGSLVDPKVYIVASFIFVAFTALVFLGIKRRTFNGEKP